MKTFCIGDSSCNNLSSDPGTKTDTTTKLDGKTLGNPPNPYGGEYGFVYWFDGSNNYDNRKSVPGALPTSPWPTIELTGLKDSTRYYALPYFKQEIIIFMEVLTEQHKKTSLEFGIQI